MLTYAFWINIAFNLLQVLPVLSKKKKEADARMGGSG
jgi:hypothetical protein